ncbi:MAG: ferredoxin [Peptostreptococcaceae bacterium]
MKVIVDQDTCIGCGMCASICSAVYEIEDDGKSHVKLDPVPAEYEGEARESCESCPVNAIEIE